MKEVMNLSEMKILKITYIQREDLMKNLKLIDAQMVKKNKEICSGQEVSTHALKVSIPEDSEQRFNSENISVDTSS